MRNLFLASAFVFFLSVGTSYLLLNKHQSFGAAANISTTGTSTLKALNITPGCLSYNGGACIGVTTAPARLVFISTTNISPSDNSYATSTGLVIPSGFLSASSTIEFRAQMSACSSGTSGSGTILLRNTSGQTIVSFSPTSDTNTNTGEGGWGVVTIGSNNGTWANEIFTGIAQNPNGNTGVTTVNTASIEGTAAIDLTTGTTLFVVGQSSACSVSTPSINSFSLIVNQ